MEVNTLAPESYGVLNAAHSLLDKGKKIVVAKEEYCTGVPLLAKRPLINKLAE